MDKPLLDIWYPYPQGTGPSQRFRIEQYIPFLEERFEVRIFPFWPEKAWEILYKKGYFFMKVIYFLSAFAARFTALWKARKAEFVYIHREAAPVGGPLFESILSKWMGKKLIYDFDDAIWLPNRSEANRGIVKHVKTHSKVGKICRMAYRVSVCNDFLAKYVLQFRPDVVLLPTTIDTGKLHHPDLFRKEKNEIPVIGWTGSHSTLAQLNIVWDALGKIRAKIPFEFHLISDFFPDTVPEFVKCIPWNKMTEIEDLLKFDIGIMPLYNFEWEKGKCGFKLLQYMALEIPAVASASGMNTKIISDGADGFLVENQTEKWVEKLTALLENQELRQRFGREGRKKIKRYYSVEANREKVLNLFT